MSEGDIPAVLDLVNRHERHWGLPLRTSLEQLCEQHFEDPGLRWTDDVRVVRRRGSLVGFGTAGPPDIGNGVAQVYLYGVVDPGHRGLGVGRSLLDRQLERGSEQLSGVEPALDRMLRVEAFSWVDDAHRLFARFGFSEARRFCEMSRTLTSDLVGPRPVGFRTEPFDLARSEELRRLWNLAFADHWGASPRDREAFARRLEWSGNRLDLSFFAVADDRLVGYLVTGFYPEDQEAGETVDGWIDSIGTHPDWRGRGVATALIHTALGAYRGAGFTHAKLGVDPQNVTGAFRLYQSLGFVTEHESITHTRAPEG